MAKRKNTKAKHSARATARQLRVKRLQAETSPSMMPITYAERQRAERHVVKGTPPAAYLEARYALVRGEKRKPWSYRAHMHDTNETTWITAAGQRIKVAEMRPDHLVNTVRLLRRKAPNAKLAELLIFLQGPRPMGDMARDGFNNAIEEMADESPEEFLVRTCPPYRAMLARYPSCVEALEDKERRDLDEALYDPWGNS